MTSVQRALTPEQQNFLKNFVVRDPATGECHTDFSRLLTYQVILMGERHSSPTLQKIQGEFLQLIIGNEPACMLGEGLSIGEEIKVHEDPRWPNAPRNLVMRGADNRNSGKAHDYISWAQLDQQYAGMLAENRQRMADAINSIATILNRYFIEHGFRSPPRNDKVFLVSQQILEDCEQIWSTYEKWDDQQVSILDQLLEQKNKLAAAANRTKFTSNVAPSNRGLAKEITKANQAYDKLIAIWGKDHFIYGDELMRALDKAGLSYIILLPTPPLENQVAEEFDLSDGTMPYSTMVVGVMEDKSNWTATSFEIPKIFQNLFHLELRKILIPQDNETEQKPFIIDAGNCVDLKTAGEAFVFAANRPFHFEHVPLTEYLELDELLDDQEGIALQRQQIQVQDHIVSMLNNILMFRHSRVSKLEFEGKLTCSTFDSLNKPVLALSSDRRFKASLEQDWIGGHASYLFKEMKRLRRTTFSLSPDETLFFYDFSLEETMMIRRNPDAIFSCLESKLPPKTRLTTSGDLEIERGSKLLIEGQRGTIRTGLFLTTEKGFTFHID
jgi:hypothetical protein